MSSVWTQLEPHLAGVEKPARYIGCEDGAQTPEQPIGACVARADIMDWKPGAHASTFGGNPVCIAAALKTIELLEGGLRATLQPTASLETALSSATVIDEDEGDAATVAIGAAVVVKDLSTHAIRSSSRWR